MGTVVVVIGGSSGISELNIKLICNCTDNKNFIHDQLIFSIDELVLEALLENKKIEYRVSSKRLSQSLPASCRSVYCSRLTTWNGGKFLENRLEWFFCIVGPRKNYKTNNTFEIGFRIAERATDR